MTVDEQVAVMMEHLAVYRGVADKAAYMYFMFDPDPEFTEAARAVVKFNIAKTIKVKL